MAEARSSSENPATSFSPTVLRVDYDLAELTKPRELDLGIDGRLLEPHTAEELKAMAEKSVCPIKKKYIARNASILPPLPSKDTVIASASESKEAAPSPSTLASAAAPSETSSSSSEKKEAASGDKDGDGGSQSKDRKRARESEDETDEAKDKDKEKKSGKDKKKAKHRGQNHNRRPFEPKPLSYQLCREVMEGRPCSFGQHCRFKHDLAPFLSLKGPDLGQRCYIFDVNGSCRMGFACRFLNAHLQDGKLVTKEGAVPVASSSAVLDRALQTALRSRRYQYKRANLVIDEYEEYNKWRQQQQKASQTKPQAITASASDSTSISSSDSTSISSSITSTEKKDEVMQTTEENKEKTEKEEKPARRSAFELEYEDPSTRLTLALSALEPRKIDFKDKLYLAPLTTVGNLPFRRLCKSLGVDVTCGEMAMTQNIVKGEMSEWALLKRHPSEDMFGIQICGGYVDQVAQACELINEYARPDFIDLNCGCPIDQVCHRGMGAAMMGKKNKLEPILRAMHATTDIPITMKMRMGWSENELNAVDLLPMMARAGVSATTIHGRTRRQRYSRRADWNFVRNAASVASSHGLQTIGNGDVYNWQDYYDNVSDSALSTCMVARGALIKPWIFTEIKERRTWDISSSERFDLFKNFVNFGLDHWGSDTKGVEATRRFLLEWMSFTHRYVPVGLLETSTTQMNWKAPKFVCRDDLETLFASNQASDWIKVSEMLLGPVPDGFYFTPKHKANSTENSSEVEG